MDPPYVSPNEKNSMIRRSPGRIGKITSDDSGAGAPAGGSRIHIEKPRKDPPNNETAVVRTSQCTLIQARVRHARQPSARGPRRVMRTRVAVCQSVNLGVLESFSSTTIGSKSMGFSSASLLVAVAASTPASSAYARESAPKANAAPMSKLVPTAYGRFIGFLEMPREPHGPRPKVGWCCPYDRHSFQ